jgi:hypothetical protein
MANDKISLDRIDNPTREVLDNYIAQRLAMFSNEVDNLFAN